MYKNNFQNAKYYLGVLENLKVNRSAFQFIVVRKFPMVKTFLILILKWRWKNTL